ncbi:amidohydrolase [Luteitalea sp. TBR-22]|uniref:amidohydrolase n=1 Tax=Luteitalea sp. TBR-22 TaxID=2802971 RepID=UPI001AF17D31|nr:amidohydrolase [Luteitalea sp. TBR-22]BCS33076.1 amidohydrolase [Luteitalea sp. TBR-22]
MKTPTILLSLLLLARPAAPQTALPAPVPPSTDPRVARVKAAVQADVKSQALFDLGQQMNDMVFSFAELGFQEFETQKYLTGILEKEGFTVERGVAGIPTMWVARWGSGSPVIALGSDVDCIPQASQKPGVAYRDPIVDGAPGHGEGHNSGTPLNIVAALAVKRMMAREKIPGTLVIWPGIAEEQLGAKAYYVRAGLLKDVDAVLYTHVGTNLAAAWGDSGLNGLVSVEYTFAGESAHSASAPWRGKSALDAVELMNAGWNARREHLRLQQRSHYVITNGGDQPNVVPRNASVWYFFRETDEAGIRRMWAIGDRMAEGAALMTDTSWSSRVLGSAWPIHTNKALAEAMYANIVTVGLPAWSEADITLAKATQAELGVPVVGLATTIPELKGRAEIPDDEKRGGGTDDIGDISWTVPTLMLNYPANFQAGPGHNWANAIPMATPIAHKGINVGAQAQAMTIVDLLLRPEVLRAAKDYFANVQTKGQTYTPLIRPTDTPATHLNKGIQDKYRPALQKLYFDPTKYKTYLEQLGITYPTVRSTSSAR